MSWASGPVLIGTTVFIYFHLNVLSCYSDIGKKIQGTKSFQPLVGEEGKEEDSDTDNLVVDENPRRGKRAPTSSSASTMKPGSLKLKLSCEFETKYKLVIKFDPI